MQNASRNKMGQASLHFITSDLLVNSMFLLRCVTQPPSDHCHTKVKSWTVAEEWKSDTCVRWLWTAHWHTLANGVRKQGRIAGELRLRYTPLKKKSLRNLSLELSRKLVKYTVSDGCGLLNPRSSCETITWPVCTVFKTVQTCTISSLWSPGSCSNLKTMASSFLFTASIVRIKSDYRFYYGKTFYRIWEWHCSLWILVQLLGAFLDAIPTHTSPTLFPSSSSQKPSELINHQTKGHQM